jgi:steroid delta-isomerase
MELEERIRETISSYLALFSAGDREGWLALFAPDATLEDPVGSPVLRGREEIATFWDNTFLLADSITLVLVQGPGVCGNEAAFAMEARGRTGDSEIVIPTIDVMAFDDEARIRSQRAFWNASSMLAGV